jgi:N-acetylglucosamine kinase-like BadF-type ATPase
MLVIGADLGGTGARAALALDGHVIAETSVEGITDRVATVESLVRELLMRTQRSKVDAVAVGATGYFMRGQALREQVPPMMFQVFGAQTVLLCSDMLSGYAGALGLNPGVVIAAGTGAVALGSDLQGTWSRVDGWGYLVGDCGGGSWIGRTALQAALRAADGRPDGSAALLAALREHFGEPEKMVAQLAEREDRAGMMAGFVPLVEKAGDPVSQRILAQAGAHLAETARSAIVTEPVVATTGNLFRVRAVRESFRANMPAQIDVRRALGSGVDGALLLAAAASNGTLPPNAPCERFTARRK